MMCAPAIDYRYTVAAVYGTGWVYVGQHGITPVQGSAMLISDFDEALEIMSRVGGDFGIRPVPVCPRCRRAASVHEFEQDGRRVLDISCARCSSGRTISEIAAHSSMHRADVIDSIDTEHGSTWMIDTEFETTVIRGGILDSACNVETFTITIHSGGDPASSPINIIGSDFVRIVVGERADIEKAIRTVLATA